jgi:hypothetical protein
MTFKLKTDIKKSSIDGAGLGRFFGGNFKKGEILRIQDLNNCDHIVIINNEKEAILYDMDFMYNFGHSIPDDNIDKSYEHSIFLNVPPMFSNHSFTPNIRYKYEDDKKITMLTKDVKEGEEIVQDYSKQTNVDWYINLLNKNDLIPLQKQCFLY